MASFDIENLINDFSNLSITNNNNFNDEINEFMNIDINHPEKYKFPNAIIYGFKKIGDNNKNNFFYIGSSVNFYKVTYEKYLIQWKIITNILKIKFIPPKDIKINKYYSKKSSLK